MLQLKKYLSHILTLLGIIPVLGVVCLSTPELPVGEFAGQWLWLGKACVFFAVCILFVFTVCPKQPTLELLPFSRMVVWTLIMLGGMQAVWGLRQIYGLSYSNHSLFAVTGSFFNPGPYSGYLAMVFPLCLNEWLALKSKKNKRWTEEAGCYIALAAMLLIICVLPSGMSRSAWLAAAISGLWIYGMHRNWRSMLNNFWIKDKRRVLWIASISFVVLFLLLGAAFYLKKDSANGRLFMWKISLSAIADKPLLGHGRGSFSATYGAFQEAYFSRGDFSPQEELVAGSPEYAFNEYLQIAVEWGIPMLLCIVLALAFCLWFGVKNGQLSACGGVISLMVFSFSSYPLQYPAFVISLLFLLMACLIANSRKWILLVFAIVMGGLGSSLWCNDKSEACREWANARIFYLSGNLKEAQKDYERLYPLLRNRATFLFEYGHCLHKQKKYEASNVILKEAATCSCDPMILNIIGKNYQQMGEYVEAEKFLIRSTHLLPGRIYPYYLLAKLYAEPEFYNSDKLRQSVEIVLTKEPKVQSTAVKQMREEARKLLGNH
ncbi:O-antigen ligase family protein [uncultured Bacteroides sp.]|jgi:O-antigen ligase|uniref:O-antigen ligase family protein n=1 Tax=uncultured Bacteroides sp. TaxID=162156 RepID=UPI00280BD3C1|nr:O-antigen ligase family protein [uncultured Bacteroides sp.]